MTRFALTIEYDGRPYMGWQRQAQGLPSVQAAVERALGKLEPGPHTIAAAGRWGSKQRELACARLHGLPSMCRTKKKPAPRRAAGVGGWDQAATSCRASATSTESPSWFSTSSPDSGTSPDVLCETMIFRAISPRQVICEEAA